MYSKLKIESTKKPYKTHNHSIGQHIDHSIHWSMNQSVRTWNLTSLQPLVCNRHRPITATQPVNEWMNVYYIIAVKRLDCDNRQYKDIQYNTKLVKRHIQDTWAKLTQRRTALVESAGTSQISVERAIMCFEWGTQIWRSHTEDSCNLGTPNLRLLKSTEPLSHLGLVRYRDMTAGWMVRQTDRITTARTCLALCAAMHKNDYW